MGFPPTGNPGFRSGHMFQPAPGRASQTCAPPTCWSHPPMPSTTFAVKAADHMNWHTLLEPCQWWDLWYNGWWTEVSCCSTKKLACSFVVPGNWCVKNSICLKEQLGCCLERQPGGLIHPHVFQESVGTIYVRMRKGKPCSTLALDLIERSSDRGRGIYCNMRTSSFIYEAFVLSQSTCLRTEPSSSMAWTGPIGLDPCDNLHTSHKKNVSVPKIQTNITVKQKMP